MWTLVIAVLVLGGCGKRKCAVFADVQAKCTADQLQIGLGEVGDRACYERR